MGLETILQYLTDDTALRVYALAGGAILFIASLWLARRQRMAILGPSPFRGSGQDKKLRARLAFLEANRSGLAGKLVVNFLAVVLFGLIVPSALILLGLYYFDWLVPGSQAFAGTKASLQQIGSYLLSQFGMGTQTESLTPASSVVATGTVVYRYFIAAFVLMSLHLVWVLFRSAGSREQQIEACRRLLGIRAPAAHDDHGHGQDAQDHGDHGHGDHGHGHDDHGHGHEVHGADDHGHGADHGHGHDDHGQSHDDHGHGAHDHDDHGHGHKPHH